MWLMKKKWIRSGLLFCCALQSTALVSMTKAETNAGNEPVVLGSGVGLYEVGPAIAMDDFENLDNWVVQVQEKPGAPPANIVTQNGSLDCFLPDRGATIWYKGKFPTRVSITYDVICPKTDPSIDNLMPRDINNFWMASDPLDHDQGLFDSEHYTGAFKTYDKMRGYYASIGGGRNTTTRMRRYPREVDGQPTPHIALKDKDGMPDFLITPDTVMTIQLVAYDDVIQYIVDRRLVYEMKRGDEVQVEQFDENGKRVSRTAVYTQNRFPVYQEGYFGFRMVGTHHIYSNFRVHALTPADHDREGNAPDRASNSE